MKLITVTGRIRAFAVLRRHSRVRFSPFRRKVYGMAQRFMTYSHICPSTIVFLWFSDTVLVMRLPQAGLACGKRPGEDQLSDVLSLAARCLRGNKYSSGCLFPRAKSSSNSLRESPNSLGKLVRLSVEVA